MKLTIIISSNNVEKNWNAFRLANLAIGKGDEVNIFLLGEGVEYDQSSTEKFDMQGQVDAFLASDKGKILACGTCMKLRNQQSTEACPIGALEDLYSLVCTGDKVLSF